MIQQAVFTINEDGTAVMPSNIIYIVTELDDRYKYIIFNGSKPSVVLYVQNVSSQLKMEECKQHAINYFIKNPDKPYNQFSYTDEIGFGRGTILYSSYNSYTEDILKYYRNTNKRPKIQQIII